jgi:PPOX class probable F420-dependent enzyme
VNRLRDRRRSRETLPVSLAETQARLLRGPNVGVVTTLRADGSPHATPVWVDWDGRQARFVIRVGQAKERHLRRDDRVSLVVVNAADPYEYVSIAGRAVLTENGAEALVARLARKYLGRSDYPADDPGAVRVVVTIEAERVRGRERPANNRAATGV